MTTALSLSIATVHQTAAGETIENQRASIQDLTAPRTPAGLDVVGVHPKRTLHEMTTAQESESSSHFDRNVRSIVVGVENATAFGHVSQ
jgi:hypothetical protein